MVVGDYRGCSRYEPLPLSYATFTCLRSHKLTLRQVLQCHTTSWALITHTGKNCKGLISSRICVLVKGNEFLMLCGIVGRSAMYMIVE